MMLTGKQLKAAKAKKAGLVDRVIEELGNKTISIDSLLHVSRNFFFNNIHFVNGSIILRIQSQLWHECCYLIGLKESR